MHVDGKMFGCMEENVCQFIDFFVSKESSQRKCLLDVFLCGMTDDLTTSSGEVALLTRYFLPFHSKIVLLYYRGLLLRRFAFHVVMFSFYFRMIVKYKRKTLFLAVISG